MAGRSRDSAHASTLLFGIVSEANRFMLGAEISESCHTPEPGQKPTMDGFVTGYAATCPGGTRT
jgi:hypothetical protein